MQEKPPMPPFESLEVSEHVRLQALRVEDAQKMFEVTTVNRDYLAEFLPWAAQTNNVNDSLAFIEATIAKRVWGEEYGFAIMVDGDLAGHTSLMHVKDGNTPEIGYWIAQSYSGRGIVTQTTEALTDFGLQVLSLDRILIRARTENAGSNAVARKLGYTLVETVTTDDEIHNHWLKERRPK